MKLQLLLLFVFIINTFCSFGQKQTNEYLPSNRGSMLLSSELGLLTAKEITEVNGIFDEKTTESAFIFSPTFGYFFNPNIVGGLKLQFQINDIETVGLFGPFLKSYLYLSNSQAIFASTSFGIEGGRTSNSNGVNSSNVRYKTSLGVGYTVISHSGNVPVGLEITGKYVRGIMNSNIQANGQNTNVKNTLNQFNISLGLSFYLLTENNDRNQVKTSLREHLGF